MTSSRDLFLERVRQAVREGNRAGVVPGLPDRGRTSYQGGGADLAAHFVTAFAAAGGQTHRVADAVAALEKIGDLIRSKSARRILLSNDPLLDSLHIHQHLSTQGLQVTSAMMLPDDPDRARLFAADLGITGVSALIAETGSLVLRCRPEEPRSLSLLPPVHIALAQESQLLPDLFDLFEQMPRKEGRYDLPSCLTLVTGPSKTGDIELRLVTGVHGPGEVHVILLKSKVSGTFSE